jgi:hypothetical protein
MAFTDAMFSGKTQLDGVYAKRSRQPEDLRCMVDCGRAVPVVSGDIEYVVSALNPDVVIDARMRKRVVPEPQRHLAPRTIGLGPNFVAGEQAELRSKRRGAWLRAGDTPGTTRPRRRAARDRGHMRDRYGRAGCRRIFDRAQNWHVVAAGETVASIGASSFAHRSRRCAG